MTIKCLLVDDEKLARELIATHLKQFPDYEIVASCASAIEASQVLQENVVDLMFLDIEMPVLKGTDFYQSLSNKPQVIFTTAYRDYALDGFELDAVDYLLKPITFARFFKAIERHRKTQHPLMPSNKGDSADGFIYIKANRKHIKLQTDDILYIQGMKDYLQIHTLAQTHTTKITMKTFLATLPDKFIQVHRSYIINKIHITAFTKYDIELGNIEIPIGETFQNKLDKLFQ